MGTWDAGSFGNDTAGDWSYGLKTVDDLSYVEAALDHVLSHNSTSAVPAESAEAAVAAVEVIARLNGHWGEENPYTQAADDWVRARSIKPPQALITKALQTLDRVAVPPSELLELWTEAGDTDSWLAAIAELRHRVEAR